MNLLRNISPATRLSVTLSAATASLLFVAETIGLLPAGDTPADERLRLVESLGLQISLSSQSGDEETVLGVAGSLVSRHGKLESIGLRDNDGALLLATDRHEQHWSLRPEDNAKLSHVEVPLYHDDEVWASTEFCFTPISRHQMLLTTGLRLTLFVSLGAFLGFQFYLRRVLRYLDPSSVIPDRVKSILDTMAEGVVVLDDRERIVLANEVFVEAAGLPLEKLQGRQVSELPWRFEESEDSAEFPWTEAVTGGKAIKGIELRVRRPDRDDLQTFMVNSTPILGADGKCRGAMATFDDMTAIEQKNAKLEDMVLELNAVRMRVERQNDDLRVLATRDALTGCLNRRALFEQFENEWDRARRHGHSVGCIMMDIDHFKAVNDNHGHQTGDEVLRRVAAVLETTTRKADVVGRYGGEEFCVVLPHVDVDGTAQAAEKLRAAIEAEPLAGLPITMSLGVSAMELGSADPQQLIDQADRALYAAKHRGRNQYVRWDRMPEVDESASAPVPDDRPVMPEADHVPIPYHAVLALMSALEQRHADTAAHSRRVAELCMMTAQGLMSAGDAFVLEVAALLHDIGKIGVPDAILLKPGKLTEQEWQVMGTHDKIGDEIISSAFNCPPLTSIVCSHHASFGGGSRHPNLPTGHGIPLRARILTVADAYDAMVSDRVYRKGMTQEKAFEELRRCAGTQFDPDIVARFIDRLTAQQGGREPRPVDESIESLLRLGVETERIASALQENDIRAIEDTARRLHIVANQHQWSRIAELSEELAGALEADSDLADVLESTRDLLRICQETQGRFLSAVHETERAPMPNRQSA